MKVTKSRKAAWGAIGAMLTAAGTFAATGPWYAAAALAGAAGALACLLLFVAPKPPQGREGR